jgi:hypothetical protein
MTKHNTRASANKFPGEDATANDSSGKHATEWYASSEKRDKDAKKAAKAAKKARKATEKTAQEAKAAEEAAEKAAEEAAQEAAEKTAQEAKAAKEAAKEKADTPVEALVEGSELDFGDPVDNLDNPFGSILNPDDESNSRKGSERSGNTDQMVDFLCEAAAEPEAAAKLEAAAEAATDSLLSEGLKPNALAIAWEAEKKTEILHIMEEMQVPEEQICAYLASIGKTIETLAKEWALDLKNYDDNRKQLRYEVFKWICSTESHKVRMILDNAAAGWIQVVADECAELELNYPDAIEHVQTYIQHALYDSYCDDFRIVTAWYLFKGHNLLELLRSALNDSDYKDLPQAKLFETFQEFNLLMDSKALLEFMQSETTDWQKLTAEYESHEEYPEVAERLTRALHELPFPKSEIPHVITLVFVLRTNRHTTEESPKPAIKGKKTCTGILEGRNNSKKSSKSPSHLSANEEPDTSSEEQDVNTLMNLGLGNYGNKTQTIEFNEGAKDTTFATLALLAGLMPWAESGGKCIFKNKQDVADANLKKLFAKLQITEVIIDNNSYSIEAPDFCQRLQSLMSEYVRYHQGETKTQNTWLMKMVQHKLSKGGAKLDLLTFIAWAKCHKTVSNIKPHRLRDTLAHFVWLLFDEKFTADGFLAALEAGLPASSEPDVLTAGVAMALGEYAPPEKDRPHKPKAQKELEAQKKLEAQNKAQKELEALRQQLEDLRQQLEASNRELEDSNNELDKAGDIIEKVRTTSKLVPNKGNVPAMHHCVEFLRPHLNGLSQPALKFELSTREDGNLLLMVHTNGLQTVGEINDEIPCYYILIKMEEGVTKFVLRVMCEVIQHGKEGAHSIPTELTPKLNEQGHHTVTLSIPPCTTKIVEMEVDGEYLWARSTNLRQAGLYFNVEVLSNGRITICEDKKRKRKFPEEGTPYELDVKFQRRSHNFQEACDWKKRHPSQSDHQNLRRGRNSRIESDDESDEPNGSAPKRSKRSTGNQRIDSDEEGAASKTPDPTPIVMTREEPLKRARARDDDCPSKKVKRKRKRS